MPNYEPIKSSTIVERDGKRYFVRRFGISGVVLEEQYVPIPETRIIKVLNEDGTEVEEKRETIIDPRLMALNGKTLDTKTGEWVPIPDEEAKP